MGGCPVVHKRPSILFLREKKNNKFKLKEPAVPPRKMQTAELHGPL
jgi:hypothetical protein